MSLPTNLFVIQLQASSGASDVVHRGHAERLASDRGLSFTEEGEFWAFVNSVLATVPKTAPEG